MPNFAKRMDAISGDVVDSILKFSSNPEILSFSLGSPAKELLPIGEIKNIINKVLDEDGTRVLSYGLTEGWLPLKKAYLEHLVHPKGVKADLNNVIITTGSTQAIEIFAEVFLDEGDTVLVEAPTFFATLGVFDKFGAQSIAVATDDQGLIIEDLEAKIKEHRPKILYTIPTFQNPTGNTIPLERRKRIAQLAAEYDFVVMEDDPYCDLRYKGEPIAPIKAFDTTGHVALINSFSKILAPGLRVGAVVASPEIIEKLIVTKQGADTHSTNLAQAICAEFLNSGVLPNHLKNMVPLYTERLEGMLAAIEKYFPKGTKYTKPEGGLFVWVDLPGDLDTHLLLEKAAKEIKVSYVPGAPFFLNPEEGKNSLRLNFSSNIADRNEYGLQLLGEFFTKELNKL